MHIHKPKAPHGWRELLTEIGVIVVGIVIAIGLEQIVEFFHHNEQREQLIAALRRDGEANRGYARQDIAAAEGILAWAVAQAAVVERAGPRGPLVLRPIPREGIGSPDAGVWPSARANGVTQLLPSSAQNWLEYLAEVSDDTFRPSSGAAGQLYAAYANLDQVFIGHAVATRSGDVDLSSLSPAQRAAAVERLHAVAERAKSVLRQLLIYDAGNDYILAVPLDQLDTPQAGARYTQILKAKMQAHPAVSYTFGGG